MNNNSKLKILFLAVNPKNTKPLRLDQEVREIDHALVRSKERNRLELVQKWAVHAEDIQRAILDVEPDIVHFSGHGAGKQGLAIEEEAGLAKLLSTEAIANLFSLFIDCVECVVLNACYSEVQALAIAKHIPYVIGMNTKIGDVAATKFAMGFYDALGAGRDIEFAYRFAVSAIRMEGIDGVDTPVLIQQQQQTIQSRAQQVFDPNANFHVVLSDEARCHEEIQKAGALIRIKSPNDMGKTVLMNQVLENGKELGYRVASLNLNQTNQKFFDDIDLFMQWFCASVGKQLGVQVKVKEIWDDIFGANDNCTDYFENYLLKDDQTPIILAIDNFDRVFGYPDIETDFCGLLRGWYERSKSHSEWEQLRLIIVHSQEPLAQRDINQSPFNVGMPVELQEFSAMQVTELVARHGLQWSAAEIKQLTDLIGGHPYLVRTALKELASGDLTLGALLKTGPTEAGIFSSHLRGHLKMLEDFPELGEAMRQVLRSSEPVRLKSEESFRLYSRGLVVRVQNEVVPRCNLYRLYLGDRLEI